MLIIQRVLLIITSEIKFMTVFVYCYIRYILLCVPCLENLLQKTHIDFSEPTKVNSAFCSYMT